MSRRFTFIYIPESGKQVRRLAVPRFVVSVLLGGLLLPALLLFSGRGAARTEPSPAEPPSEDPRP